MKPIRFIQLAILTFFFISAVIFSQDSPNNPWRCGTQNKPASLLDIPRGDTTMDVVYVFIDFPDGRLLNGEIPLTNEELDDVANIDAVLSMGFITDDGEIYSPVVHKYKYDDFWNMYFSTDVFFGSAHPDYSSHGQYGWPPDGDTAKGWGSFSEYFSAASYGHFTVNPPVTHQNDTGLYRTGIVNNILLISGKRYIDPIMLNNTKTSYGIPNVNYMTEANGMYAIMSDARQKVISMYPNEIEFDLAAHLANGGRVIYVFAGGSYNTGGVTGGYNYCQEIVLREKRSVNNGDYPKYKVINGLTVYCHEFGHSIGFGHSGIGNYDVMTEGTDNQNCPSYFNIVSRLQAGWIEPEYIRLINTSQSVTNLPPSAYNGDCAIITIYGKAGFSETGELPNFEHSEYYVLGNRRMLRDDPNVKFDKKFVYKTNRMPDPSVHFNGGCMIYHYSPYNNMGTYLGIKIENADPQYPVAITDEGHSNHFYGVEVIDGTFDDLTDEAGRTNSSYDLRTGIDFTNILEDASGDIGFTINYSLGTPPDYERVFYGQTITESLNLSGIYFVHQCPSVANVTINPGAVFDCRPGSQFGAEVLSGPGNLDAQGSVFVPIVFRGMGYSTYRTTGGGLRYYTDGNTNTSAINIKYVTFDIGDSNSDAIQVVNNNSDKDLNIENITNSASAKFEINFKNSVNNVNINNIDFVKKINITFTNDNATGSVSVNNITSGDNSELRFNMNNSPQDIDVANINFSAGIKKLYLSSSGSARAQFGSITNVNFNRYIVFGLWDFNMNNDLVIPSGAELLMQNKGGTTVFTNIDFTAGHKFYIEGTVRISGTNSLNNDLYIAPGGTCKISSFESPEFTENYFLFAAGKGILCDGVLDAQVLSDSLYLDVYGPGQWSGISCTNPANIILNNVKIKNAETGIYVNNPAGGVNIQKSTFTGNTVHDMYLDNLASGNLEPYLIKENTFTGNDSKLTAITCNNCDNVNIESNVFDVDFTTGLELQGVSTAYVKQNTFKATTNQSYSPIGLYSVSSGGIFSCNDITNYSEGVRLSGSSPYLYNNDIYNNGYGLYCLNSSSPIMTVSGLISAGYNRIHDNLAEEVYCENSMFLPNSLPVLADGNNSFYDNNSDCLINLTDISLSTEYNIINNYWGGGDPGGRLCPASVTFVYDPYYTTEPEPPGSCDPFSPSAKISYKNSGSVFAVNNSKIISGQSEYEKFYVNLEQLKSLCVKLGSFLKAGNRGTADFDMNEFRTIVENSLSMKMPEMKSTVKCNTDNIDNGSDIRKDNSKIDYISMSDKLNQLNKLIKSCGLEKITRENLSLLDALKITENLISYKLYEFALMNNSPDRRPLDRMEPKRKLTALKDNNLPKTFKLYQNYPNPFNPVSAIKFDVPKTANVTIKVYDLLGKEVIILVNELKQPGYYEARFDGTNFSSGVYFYRIDAGTFTDVKKMVLVK